MEIKVDSTELFKQMKEEATKEDQFFHFELIVAKPENGERFEPTCLAEGQGGTDLLWAALKCLASYIEEMYKETPELKVFDAMEKAGFIKQSTKSIRPRKEKKNEYNDD